MENYHVTRTSDSSTTFLSNSKDSKFYIFGFRHCVLYTLILLLAYINKLHCLRSGTEPFRRLGPKKQWVIASNSNSGPSSLVVSRPSISIPGCGKFSDCLLRIATAMDVFRAKKALLIVRTSNCS